MLYMCDFVMSSLHLLLLAEDPTADAAIINVTGSNSVNVFLGLGLPWTVAAVIWAVRGQTAEWLTLYHAGPLKLPWNANET